MHLAGKCLILMFDIRREKKWEPLSLQSAHPQFPELQSEVNTVDGIFRKFNLAFSKTHNMVI